MGSKFSKGKGTGYGYIFIQSDKPYYYNGE